MTIILDAKKKSALIDGSLARPSNSHASFWIWSRCNSMVKFWILNSISKQIYKSILRFNDASEIWNDLSARFHITNLPRSYMLFQQIWSLQQGSMDLASYYKNLKTLRDKLDGLLVIDVIVVNLWTRKLNNQRSLSFWHAWMSLMLPSRAKS